MSACARDVNKGHLPIAAALVLLCGAGLAACSAPTEIVLVVDTNLTRYDIDEVALTITGSQTQSIDVLLAAPGAPAFPLTLGLRPAGAASAVKVSAVGKLGGLTVVAQEADTAFADGQQKMLRLLLLDSCVGLTCPATPAAQTCNAGACMAANLPAASLPAWPGSPPPSPPAATTTPLGGRTLWADGWHSCANEGSVLYCWGQNSDGEIGDGTTRNANSRHPVMGLSDVATVGLGELTSCACDRSGQAWCWGRNVEGELGIGTASANSKLPVQVPGVTDCVQIGGGANHTCVLHGNGTVSCWGSNASGQLGQPASATPATCAESAGTMVACATSPALVSGLTGVVEVHGGEQHTCARKTDMTVVCWGDNSNGQLGDGTTTARSTPVQVVALNADVVELSVGRWFNCARHATGALSCWGMNGTGQLGNGSKTDSSRPVAVATISDAIQVAAGFQHACALGSTGVVSCWGSNALGQLGNGTNVDALAPVATAGLLPVNAIAVGSVHSCARTPSGAAFCWGENLVNQVGDGTTTNRNQPVSVAGFM